MLELFSELNTQLVIVLILSIGLVAAFEFINGFHDIANAVATVIYTQSMKPQLAVLVSGVSNFAGVLAGGLAVAYVIVNLLPMDMLISINTTSGMVMVFSLLLSAILWNLGTWYFGLPASSSHTLIGSILGVGLVHAWLTHQSWQNGVNWSKAIDVGLSLLISPIIGFSLAGLMVFFIRKILPNSNIHKSPYQRQDIEGRKHPPFWSRFMLIISAIGVSFAHGSNDGQKGVGLVMLVLIGIAPAHYVLNQQSNTYQIERTRDAVIHLENLLLKHQAQLSLTFSETQPINQSNCDKENPIPTMRSIQATLNNINSYKQLRPDQRWTVRTNLLCLSDFTKHAIISKQLREADKNHLKDLEKDITKTIEYAPLWVILLIATSLGCGTLVGWRRVVKTVGEGIGKKNMTYGQGVCAQLTAAISIGFANIFGLPVSTTQVLSSGIAGTMVAEKAGLQSGTVRNILLTWLLTFPIAMMMSGLFYYIGIINI